MAYDLVIKDGHLITGHQRLDADVGIQGEQIAAIGHGLTGKREIDASGLCVLPGAIDAHVHFDNPTFPPHDYPTADAFATGTVAAAFGGVTTVIDFAQPRPGQSLPEEVERRKQDAHGQCVIDYSLHLNYRDPDPARLAEIPAVFEQGVPTFKLYMAYEGYRLSDVPIFRVMEAVAARDGLVIMHAENFDIVQEMQRRLDKQDRTGPQWHTASHPAVMEAEGIYRSLALAQLAGVRVLIFHVSCRQGVREIRHAKGRGQAAYGEACIHHLAYTDQVYNEDSDTVRSLMVVPPIRDETHRRALWQGVVDGTLDIVSTDHCPRPRLPDCEMQAPGASGLEVRLALMHTLGVRAGRIDLNRWVTTCCTRPAELFGLKRKGRIAPGYDADLVLFDPLAKVTLSANVLHTPLSFSSYDGVTVEGYPYATLSRGEVIVGDGELLAEPGRGRFIERSFTDGQLV
jgi:dihydropyrimidinase